MDELYYVDFFAMPKPIRRLRFEQLQTLAFSKGIGWIGTGKSYQEYRQISLMGGSIEVCINHIEGIRGKHKFLGYGSNDNLISYRDIIKKLRSLWKHLE